MAKRSRRKGAALRRRYGRRDRRVVRDTFAVSCRRLPSGSDDKLTCLIQSIAATVASARVTGFHIGRSVSIERRASGHDADEIASLLETSSLRRAAAVEDALLKHFRRHPKNSNLRADSGGGTAEGRQHVYLALRFA